MVTVVYEYVLSQVEKPAVLDIVPVIGIIHTMNPTILHSNQFFHSREGREES